MTIDLSRTDLDEPIGSVYLTTQSPASADGRPVLVAHGRVYPDPDEMMAPDGIGPLGDWIVERAGTSALNRAIHHELTGAQRHLCDTYARS